MLRFHQSLRSCTKKSTCYFNTSHVTVPPAEGCIYCGNKEYFNTSHVTVPHSGWVNPPTVQDNFNTSHVTVPQISISRSRKGEQKFQYITCYGSTVFGLLIYTPLIEFQYITCYGSTRYPQSSCIF